VYVLVHGLFVLSSGQELHVFADLSLGSLQLSLVQMDKSLLFIERFGTFRLGLVTIKSKNIGQTG
jgi:hypothetical protein